MNAVYRDQAVNRAIEFLIHEGFDELAGTVRELLEEHQRLLSGDLVLVPSEMVRDQQLFGTAFWLRQADGGLKRLSPPEIVVTFSDAPIGPQLAAAEGTVPLAEHLKSRPLVERLMEQHGRVVGTSRIGIGDRVEVSSAQNVTIGQYHGLRGRVHSIGDDYTKIRLDSGEMYQFRHMDLRPLD